MSVEIPDGAHNGSRCCTMKGNQLIRCTGAQSHHDGRAQRQSQHVDSKTIEDHRQPPQESKNQRAITACGMVVKTLVRCGIVNQANGQGKTR